VINIDIEEERKAGIEALYYLWTM